MSRRNISGMSGFQANRIKSKMMRSQHCSTTAQKHVFPLFASENMGVLTDVQKCSDHVFAAVAAKRIAMAT